MNDHPLGVACVIFLNAETQISRKTINNNADKKHNNLRGSPKRWATSTNHRYWLSYYLDQGDYNRLTFISHTSHYTISSIPLYASTGLHQ